METCLGAGVYGLTTGSTLYKFKGISSAVFQKRYMKQKTFRIANVRENVKKEI